MTKIYVIMDDETQQACPVEAGSPDEAREIVGKMLGKDVGDLPVYDASSDDDINAIIAIVANS